MKRSVKKYVLVTAGSIALVLGIVGIVIPLLPTTPFLLLASFCYIRSSERLHNRLLANRVLGPYIHDYLNHRAVKRGVKVATMVLLWLALIVSTVLVSNIYLRVFLVVVGIGVSIHISSLRTLRDDGPCGTSDDHG